MGLESWIGSVNDISLSSNTIFGSGGVNGEAERDLFLVMDLLVLSTGMPE